MSPRGQQWFYTEVGKAQRGWFVCAILVLTVRKLVVRANAGTGATAGAGITRDVSDDVIVAGSPARPLKGELRLARGEIGKFCQMQSQASEDEGRMRGYLP